MGNNTDQTIETINRGRTARVIRSQTEDMLIDQEDRLISIMIVDYRSGRLTDEKMRGKIGEISSLRWIREELEATIRKGDAEAEREYDNAQES